MTMLSSGHLYSGALTMYITITTLLDQHRELSDHIHQFLTFERNDTDQRYADAFRSASPISGLTSKTSLYSRQKPLCNLVWQQL